MPDSQFPENNVTGTLTAGKLATTDTSATSIDVAGGVTAGTGNVAIVNAAGKIPALSSTYLASLDGSALTGISAGAVTGYTATTAAVSNTTSKSPVVTVGQIGADDWDDGDILTIHLAVLARNYSGSSRTVTWEVDVEGNTQTHTKSWENASAIGYMLWDITLMRAGAEVWWSFSNSQVTRSGFNPGSGSELRIASVDFTAAIDVVINITFPAADATLYITPQSANAYMTKRTT